MMAAIVLGIGCRALEYGRQRSLWHDEASIALNLRHKTARQLLGPLEYDQAAPPLFLLAERGLLLTLGASEASLRLLPLLAGVASVLLFAGLSRRLLESPWDALATFVFALSDKIIERNTELKPYGVDVAVALLLLWLATTPRSLGWRLTMLAVAGPLAVALSFPAAIVFAAVSLALLLEIRGSSAAPAAKPLVAPAAKPLVAPAAKPLVARRLAQVVLASLPTILAFAAVFLLSKAARHNSTLAEDWRDQFLDWHRPPGWPLWILRKTWAACDYAFPATGPTVLVGACLGAATLWKTGRRRILIMLAGPVALTVLATAVHGYPYDGGRLTAFLSPGLLLIAFIGAAHWHRSTGWPLRLGAPVAVAYLAAVACFWATLHALTPRHRDHLRPVAAYVRQHARPDETVYTFELRVLQWYWPEATPRQLRGWLDAAADIPGRRFWIVWCYSNRRVKAEVPSALAWAREFCDQKDRIEIDDGGAVLFERRPQAVPVRPLAPFRGPFPDVKW